MSGRDKIDVICSLFLQRDEDISKLSVSYFLAEKSIAYLIVLTETARLQPEKKTVPAPFLYDIHGSSHL